MADNPLIQRYRYSTLRPRQLWIYVAIYISIILLIVSISYSAYKYQALFKNIVELHRNLYYQFLTFQVIILLIWGAYNSGSAIKEEILNRSYDFFRMLPLPAHKKALGILIGKNLVVLLFGAINLILLVYFGTAGEININLQGQILLTFISITILINSTSLLSSINPTRKNKSSGILFILLSIFFLVPMMINAVVALSSINELESYSVYFFKMKIPILLLISFIAMYFSCWVFKGILRRFTLEQEPLFTRKGALLFLLGYIFIAAGLYYNYIPKGRPEIVYSYWLVTLMPVLAIPVGSLRNLDKYIEYSRFIQGQCRSRKTSIAPIVRHSNLALAITLFAIWAISSAATLVYAGYAFAEIGTNLYNIFTLLTCYLFLVLLLETYVVYNPVSGKIGLLLGFVTALYIILPFILSAIFDNDIIYVYSPAGFFASLFDRSDLVRGARTSYWLINLLFCVFPALLVWKRYNYVLTLRQKM